jgi:hypothetical protein
MENVLTLNQKSQIVISKEIRKRLGLNPATAKTLGGIVNPICLAALRLMISPNFVGSEGRKGVPRDHVRLRSYATPRDATLQP